MSGHTALQRRNEEKWLKREEKPGKVKATNSPHLEPKIRD